MRQIIISGLLLALFASCSSKNKEEDITTTDLLVQGKWTMYHEYYKAADGSYEELSPACLQDDEWEFNTEKSLTFGPGTLLCVPDEPAPELLTANWLLENDDKRLVVVYPFDEARYQITSISQNELILDEVAAGTLTETGARIILNR